MLATAAKCTEEELKNGAAAGTVHIKHKYGGEVMRAPRFGPT